MGVLPTKPGIASKESRLSKSWIVEWSSLQPIACCLAILLFAGSCINSGMAGNDRYSAKLSIKDVMRNFRSAARQAVLLDHQKISYGGFSRSRIYESADLIRGTVGKVTSSGCVRVRTKGVRIHSIESRCEGRNAGIKMRFLKIGPLTAILPSRLPFSPQDTNFSEPEVGYEFWDNCFIVPFPEDSLHLLIRTTIRPTTTLYRMVNVSDITSVHLIGNDLESRTMMRFEEASEYFAMVFSPQPTEIEQWYFQRATGRIRLDDPMLSLDRMKAELQSIWNAHPPANSNQKMIEKSPLFLWERDLIEGFEGDFFLERFFDRQRPFPLPMND